MTTRLFTSVVVLLASSSAFAQQRQQAEAAGGDAPAPRASEYLVKVQSAIRLAVGRDLDGALGALRDAFRDEPSSPIAHYYAGEVHRMRGEMEEALEKFRVCTDLARTARDPLYQGRCLRGQAETLERMEGRLEAARDAWTQFVQFADGSRQYASPETGRARMQALDAQREQATAYVEVRQRIEERERENARNPPRPQGGAQGQRRQQQPPAAN